MPDVKQIMDATPLLLSIVFDARVGTGSLDRIQAESCKYSQQNHDSSPVHELSKLVSLAGRMM
jgi:hypothetical protein